MSKPIFNFSKGNIPQYGKPDLKWYERDELLSYYYQLKYNEFIKSPDDWLESIEVVNFDTIHNKCRGDKMSKRVKDYKIVKRENFFLILKKRKKMVASAIARSGRKDG